MQTFYTKEVLREGWEVFKRNRKVLVLATLVYLIVTNASKNFGDLIPVTSFGLRGIVGVVLTVLSIIVQIGWFKLLLKELDKGGGKVGELFKHRVLFFRYFAAMFVYSAIVLIPILIGAGAVALLLIPHLGGNIYAMIPSAAAALAGLLIGIYLAIKYSFVVTLAIDKEQMGLKETFALSSKMTSGVKLKLVSLGIVLALVNLLGLICLVVGLLVTVPTTMLAYLIVYRKLLPPQSVPETAPILNS
jgi:hypothetical protein